MLSRLLDSHDASSRERLLRGVLLALVAAQLLAFYMLCSHQVRKQQARATAAQVERMAVSDCLQYLSNSTIAGCAGQLSQASQDGGAVRAVNYAWR